MSEYVHFGDISPRTAYKAWGKLLTRLNPTLITERFAQTKPMPKGSGKTVVFRRYIKLAVSENPAQEGVTPPGQKPTYVDVSATLEQYIGWIGITDVIEDTHEDPVLNEFSGLLEDQMRETRETLNITRLKGGTGVYYTNGSLRSSVNTVMDRGDFRKIVRDMRSNDCKFYTRILAGTAGYGTNPIGAAFIGMGHTDLGPDLANMAGYTEVKDYPNQKAIMGDSEHGSGSNIRFMLTSMFDAWADAGAAGATMIATTDAAAAVDVYPIIILSPDAWGTVPLRGANSGRIMVVNPKPAAGDPAGQRGTLAWKMWHEAVILDDDRMNRLETSATENPT